jgi:hypothetical protein
MLQFLPSPSTSEKVCIICIGVVNVVSQYMVYKCVYYYDTFYKFLPPTTSEKKVTYTTKKVTSTPVNGEELRLKLIQYEISEREACKVITSMAGEGVVGRGVSLYISIL